MYLGFRCMLLLLEYNIFCTIILSHFMSVPLMDSYFEHDYTFNQLSNS